MVFQTLMALVGSDIFHGVMTGRLKCQGAHIIRIKTGETNMGIESNCKRHKYKVVLSRLSETCHQDCQELSMEASESKWDLRTNKNI